MPTAPQLLDADSAYAIVHQRVYAPVFFEKLAQDYGIRPQDEGEALEMFSMAAKLRQQYDANLNKQAAARNPLDLVRQNLNRSLEKQGVAVDRTNAVMTRRIKQAAADGAADPVLAQAILSLQVGAYEAAQAS